MQFILQDNYCETSNPCNSCVPKHGSFSCCSAIAPCYIVGPHSTVSNVFQHEVVCPTPGCTQILSLCRWNSGSSAGHCPRFLHDMEHITLLVPAVYQYKQGHQDRINWSTYSYVLQRARAHTLYFITQIRYDTWLCTYCHPLNHWRVGFHCNWMLRNKSKAGVHSFN